MRLIARRFLGIGGGRKRSGFRYVAFIAAAHRSSPRILGVRIAMKTVMRLAIIGAAFTLGEQQILVTA
jgi:hypothetical protein